MKKIFTILTLLMSVALSVNGQSWYSNSSSSSRSSATKSSNSASLTIMNKSSYSLTVKIMRTNGRGLYQIVMIGPQSSGHVSFYKSDTFYTKTKASKTLETLYKKSGAFSIQCDETGYSQATLEFYVTSSGGGTGQGISKSEFESDK